MTKDDTGWQQKQPCGWVLSPPPELVRIKRGKDMHVWVGKLRGSNQRVIASTKGNKNAFLPFTLNVYLFQLSLGVWIK